MMSVISLRQHPVNLPSSLASTRRRDRHLPKVCKHCARLVRQKASFTSRTTYVPMPAHLRRRVSVYRARNWHSDGTQLACRVPGDAAGLSMSARYVYGLVSWPHASTFQPQRNTRPRRNGVSSIRSNLARAQEFHKGEDERSVEFDPRTQSPLLKPLKHRSDIYLGAFSVLITDLNPLLLLLILRRRTDVSNAGSGDSAGKLRNGR